MIWIKICSFFFYVFIINVKGYIYVELPLGGHAKLIILFENTIWLGWGLHDIFCISHDLVHRYYYFILVSMHSVNQVFFIFIYMWALNWSILIMIMLYFLGFILPIGLICDGVTSCVSSAAGAPISIGLLSLSRKLL